MTVSGNHMTFMIQKKGGGGKKNHYYDNQKYLKRMFFAPPLSKSWIRPCFNLMILRFKLISYKACRFRSFSQVGKLKLADFPASSQRLYDYMCFSEIRVSAMVSVNQFILILM